MEDIYYKRNFITEAISKVEFLNQLKDLNETIPKEFSDSIKDSFPIAESKEIINNVVELTNTGAITRTSEKSIEWIFWNKERTKRISLNKDFLILVQHKYESYNIFENDFKLSFNSLCDIFDNLTYKRYGMRFINNIRIDEPEPLNWNNYINENLLASINIPKDKDRISRTFHTLEMNYETFNLRYNFGIHNPDYPAVVKQKVFVLDLDAYHNGIQNQMDILDNMSIFHNKIQEFFEFSITDNFRKTYLNNE